MKAFLALFSALYLCTQLHAHDHETLKNTRYFRKQSAKGGELIIIQGGYRSCAQRKSARIVTHSSTFHKAKAVAQGVQNSKPSAPVVSIVSCYGSWLGTGLDAPLYVHQSSSDGQFQGHHSMLVRDYVRSIKTYIVAAKRAGFKVHMMGHSHGGWLAYKVLEALPPIKGRKVWLDTFVSVDPISRQECQPAYFASTALTGSIYCTQFPSDIALGLDSHLKKSYRAINFYQTQTLYLHSSAFETRAPNFLNVHFQEHDRFDYISEYLFSYNSHQMIWNSPLVWNSFAAFAGADDIDFYQL